MRSETFNNLLLGEEKNLLMELSWAECTHKNFRVLAEHIISERLKSFYISDFGFSVRTFNCLAFCDYEIRSIDKLILFSEYDLLKIRNFGHTCLDEVNEKLSSLGLTLSECDYASNLLMRNRFTLKQPTAL